MFNETKFTKKGKSLQLAASEGITDLTLMGVATEYKTAVSRKYQTLPQRLLGQTFDTASEVHASVKYDGEQVFAYYDESKGVCCAFNAPSGRCRIGLKCLKELEKRLKAAGAKKVLLVGEIYLKSAERSQVSDVIRVTFSGSDDDRDNLTLAIYDIVMLDGKNFRDNQNNFRVNLAKIEELVGTDTSAAVHVVSGQIMPGKEVKAFFEKVTTALGQEGIVVRFLNSANIYKIKPQITVDVVVIGYVEGEFEGKYGVTSLLCGIYNQPTGHIQALTRVGSGFKDDTRTQLLERLSPQKVESPLSMTDSDGRPISFVKPGMVIEIEGEGLVPETLTGKPSTSQLFKWDGKKYNFEGLRQCPILTHATFASFREDKVWDDGGTRMEQVLSAGQIAQLDKPDIVEGKPEIIKRRVFTKKSKEDLAVKKLVVIQTNSPNKHPYAILWTDFSAGRKTPLETSLMVAGSLERVESLTAALLADEIKKGWNEI